MSCMTMENDIVLDENTLKFSDQLYEQAENDEPTKSEVYELYSCALLQCPEIIPLLRPVIEGFKKSNDKFRQGLRIILGIARHKKMKNKED